MTPSKLGSYLPARLDAQASAQALEAELPYCDGRPVSDSELQFSVCAFQILEPIRRYHRNNEIYLASNMAVYFRRPVEGAEFDLAKGSSRNKCLDI